MANFLLAVKWLTETDISRTSGLAIKTCVTYMLRFNERRLFY